MNQMSDAVDTKEEEVADDDESNNVEDKSASEDTAETDTSSSPSEFVEFNDTPQSTPEFIEADNELVADEPSEASNPYFRKFSRNSLNRFIRGCSITT